MKRNVKDLTLVSILSALIIMVALIPGIGYIPIGPIRATTIHIPVIIGSILFGPKKGAILGFVFGLTSLFNNTFNPTITSFVFSPFYSGGNLLSLVICFIPRILIGIVPYYAYMGLKKLIKKDLIGLGIAGFLGSIVNTILVMGMIYLFFKEGYSAANDIAPSELYSLIIGVICINGSIEAIIAALISAFATKTLILAYRRE